MRAQMCVYVCVCVRMCISFYILGHISFYEKKLLVLQVKLSVFTSYWHGIGVPLVLPIRPIICYDKQKSLNILFCR